MNLLVGHDAAVAQWVGDKIGVPMIPPYTALGWIDNEGLLRVGFVFFGYVPLGNIDIAIASSGRLTRGILSVVADYVFMQIAAKRMTARTRRSNTLACDLLRRAGFVQECICKSFYADDDAVQFRMRKSECRWLKDR